MKRILLLLLATTLAFSTQAVAGKKKKKKKLKADTELVVRTAQSYMGTPYKYGGTSKSGIDCSALIQNSFSKAGYKLPRVSKEQSKYGKKVKWKRLQKGDLVFFKFRKKGKTWNHSGLITVAKGKTVKFIHASSSRGVVESDLMADYYKKNITGFRRVIK